MLELIALVWLLLLGLWGLMSFITILFLIRYKGLSPLVWFTIMAYCGASFVVLSFTFAQLSSSGLETIFPFFSRYY